MSKEEMMGEVPRPLKSVVIEDLKSMFPYDRELNTFSERTCLDRCLSNNWKI